MMTAALRTNHPAIAFGALAAVLAGAILAMPAAAETRDDAKQINLLRPDRLLVQITDQDRGAAGDYRRWMPAAYMGELDRGYRDVSRSNLLNSPAARYFARKLTGSGKY